jgi:hypothetical protein
METHCLELRSTALLSRNTMFLGTTLRSPGGLESNDRQYIQYYTRM